MISERAVILNTTNGHMSRVVKDLGDGTYRVLDLVTGEVDEAREADLRDMSRGPGE